MLVMVETFFSPVTQPGSDAVHTRAITGIQHVPRDYNTGNSDT